MKAGPAQPILTFLSADWEAIGYCTVMLANCIKEEESARLAGRKTVREVSGIN